jgi:hypothetical protein
MKGGIIELWQKDASLGLIRELLATVGVAVRTATIAQFLAEVSHNSASTRQRQRFRSRTRSRSEHDPSATCSRFASERRDDQQVAANATAIFKLSHRPQVPRSHLNDRVFAVCESRMLATADQTNST